MAIVKYLLTASSRLRLFLRRLLRVHGRCRHVQPWGTAHCALFRLLPFWQACTVLALWLDLASNSPLYFLFTPPAILLPFDTTTVTFRVC